MDADTLKNYLTGLPIPALRYFDEIGSTNDEALTWAEQAAEDGSLVMADRQTTGRGRMGRTWITLPGAALAFSLVFKPRPQEMRRLQLFSPLGALGVALALEKYYGLQPQVKWPNDVLLDQEKVCGVLAEASWSGESLAGVVLGIGINVAPTSVPPASQLIFPATSLERKLGHAVNRFDVLKYVLAAVFEWRRQLADDSFIQAWQDRLAFKGEHVRIEQDGMPQIEGLVTGVLPDGRLALQGLAGEALSVQIGDVHLRLAD
ncbi:MAG TPA: biotin--[acetyl-CoA-carboxylase] ligase [Longilinea sp.]|nr:biotin--[acetyl-CoA-carboxylase] ligase [Longilinea sp.]